MLSLVGLVKTWTFFIDTPLEINILRAGVCFSFSYHMQSSAYLKIVKRILAIVCEFNHIRDGFYLLPTLLLSRRRAHKNKPIPFTNCYYSSMGYTHTETELPIEDHYPKLVRDKIPEIVTLQGKQARVMVLKDDQEFLRYLCAKLIEEAMELSNAKTGDHQKEELADVNEVLSTILEVAGFSQGEIVAVQKEKRQQRGAFNNRLVLLSKP